MVVVSGLWIGGGQLAIAIGDVEKDGGESVFCFLVSYLCVCMYVHWIWYVRY